MPTQQLNREELEAKALESICPCFVYGLRNDLNYVDDSVLQEIIVDGMWSHHENQKHDPLSEEEFAEELRQCPSYQGDAA